MKLWRQPVTVFFFLFLTQLFFDPEISDDLFHILFKWNNNFQNLHQGDTLEEVKLVTDILRLLWRTKFSSDLRNCIFYRLPRLDLVVAASWLKTLFLIFSCETNSTWLWFLGVNILSQTRLSLSVLVFGTLSFIKQLQPSKKKEKDQCSDLRSEVLWCPTESLHGGSVGDAFFTEAEVCDLNMSVFVQHEVLQLRKRTREEKKTKKNKKKNSMTMCLWRF